jgi:hypothetical protein
MNNLMLLLALLMTSSFAYAKKYKIEGYIERELFAYEEYSLEFQGNSLYLVPSDYESSIGIYDELKIYHSTHPNVKTGTVKSEDEMVMDNNTIMELKANSIIVIDREEGIYAEVPAIFKINEGDQIEKVSVSINEYLRRTGLQSEYNKMKDQLEMDIKQKYRKNGKDVKIKAESYLDTSDKYICEQVEGNPYLLGCDMSVKFKVYFTVIIKN